jgi:addiction module RelE/StbE family toxin
MMRVNLDPRFKKSYKNRIVNNKNLVQQTKERINLFKVDYKNPILKDHKLTGAKKELRAFSVTGDTRILYIPVSEKEVIFIDIGSHKQVY